MALSNKQLDHLSEQQSRLNSFVGFLRTQNYTSENIKEYLGLGSISVDELLSTTGRLSLYFCGKLTSTPTTFSVLILLFFLSCEIDSALVEAALPADQHEFLKSSGLVQANDETGRTKGQVTIAEFASQYYVSDNIFYNHGDGNITEELLPDSTSSEPGVRASEVVAMPVHASTLELYRRREWHPDFRSFLDVGCGSGVQSICQVASYVRRSGIDLNPRCVTFSRLNADINGIDVDYQVADALTFRPEQKSDHVLFNCPHHFSYEDQLNPKCALAVRFIDENLESLLTPRGLCQIWTITPIPGSYGSVETILERSIPRMKERFQITIDPIKDSKFVVSGESIARNRISKSSLLAFPSVDRLKYFIQNNEITEIAISILNVRLLNG